MVFLNKCDMVKDEELLELVEMEGKPHIHTYIHTYEAAPFVDEREERCADDGSSHMYVCMYST